MYLSYELLFLYDYVLVSGPVLLEGLHILQYMAKVVVPLLTQRCCILNLWK